MANSLRNEFHCDLAAMVYNEIQFRKSNYYYFLGKIESWGLGVDLSPDQIGIDSEYENNIIRSNAIFLKKIDPNDVSLVTKRHDWTSGIIYDIWDHTKNMIDATFYCVTDDNTVYKCLDNKSGMPSTVKPSGTSYNTFRTADGYLWKYMYTVPSFKRSRFMSVDYLPVQTALSDSFYNKGSIDDVIVNNGGVGYVDSQLTHIVVSGDTTGSGAVGTVNVGPTGNITDVTITSGGTGYMEGVDILFTSADGFGAVGEAVINESGVITDITITNGGVGYENGESVVFSVGGAVIVPSVSKITHSIVAVKIVKAGAGYVGELSLTVVGAGGSGIYGNETARVSAITYNGKIVQVNITDPGAEYPVDTTTSIVVSGDGTGAQFSPVIHNGEIVDVIVDNSGTGYTSANITIVGSGVGANITARISVSDFISDQSIVEQTYSFGSIYSIPVTTAGNNYSTLTTVEVIGDGVGCLATATIVDGTISGVVVTNFGHDYTYASVSFIDPDRNLIFNKTDAVAYIILPPKNGHGYDAVTELSGSTLAINTSLRHEPLLTPLLQDFRQFGLTKKMSNIVTGRSLTNDSYLIAYNIIVKSAIGLVADEILIRENTKFRVVSVVDKSVILQQLGVSSNTNITTLYAESDPTRIYDVASIVSYPVANKYSGSLLYVSEESPFLFNEDQGIVIKTFLKF